MNRTALALAAVVATAGLAPGSPATGQAWNTYPSG